MPTENKLICAHCGLTIKGKDRDTQGHAETPLGPLHFACQNKLVERARELFFKPRLP